LFTADDAPIDGDGTLIPGDLMLDAGDFEMPGDFR
jgi:hypothetical protein